MRTCSARRCPTPRRSAPAGWPSRRSARPRRRSCGSRSGTTCSIFGQDEYDGLEGGIAGYHDTTLAFRTALDDGSTLPGMIVHPASRWLDPDETAAHGMSGTDGAVAIMAELRVTRSELGAGLHRSAVLAAPVGVVPDPDAARRARRLRVRRHPTPGWPR